MSSTINASNGTVSGLISTGDASGELQLQVNNGTPAVTLNTSGAIGVGSSPSYGTSGQLLQSNGSGASPSWVAAPSTSPAGSTGQIQYNNGGAFGAISDGTSGQVLTSAGSGASPTWTTFTSSNIGDVVYSTQAPTASWLPCNGSVYLKSSYPSLATKLGSLSNPYNGTWTASQYLSVNNVLYVNNKYYSFVEGPYSFQQGVYESTTINGPWTLISDNTIRYSSFFDGTYFLAMNTANTLYYSTNAASWSSVTLSDMSSSGTLYGFATNGSGVRVGVGKYDSSGTIYPRIQYSTNGTSWASANSIPMYSTSNAYFTNVAYGNGVFVASMYYNSGSNLYAFTSTDGLNWTRNTVATDFGSSGVGTLSDVIFVNGYFFTYSSGYQNAYKSTNGVTWTRVSNLPSTTYKIGTNGTLLLAPSGLTLNISSDLGATWTNVVPSSFAGATSLTLVTRYAPNGYFGLYKYTSGSDQRILYLGTGILYDTNTQFITPTYSSLSTLSGTYSAPVYPYIKGN